MTYPVNSPRVHTFAYKYAATFADNTETMAQAHPSCGGFSNTGCNQSITNAYPAWRITHLEEGAGWRLQDSFATG